MFDHASTVAIKTHQTGVRTLVQLFSAMPRAGELQDEIHGEGAIKQPAVRFEDSLSLLPHQMQEFERPGKSGGGSAVWRKQQQKGGYARVCGSGKTLPPCVSAGTRPRYRGPALFGGDDGRVGKMCLSPDVAACSARYKTLYGDVEEIGGGLPLSEFGGRGILWPPFSQTEEPTDNSIKQKHRLTIMAFVLFDLPEDVLLRLVGFSNRIVLWNRRCVARTMVERERAAAFARCFEEMIHPTCDINVDGNPIGHVYRVYASIRYGHVYLNIPEAETFRFDWKNEKREYLCQYFLNKEDNIWELAVL